MGTKGSEEGGNVQCKGYRGWRQGVGGMAEFQNWEVPPASNGQARVDHGAGAKPRSLRMSEWKK